MTVNSGTQLVEGLSLYEHKKEVQSFDRLGISGGRIKLMRFDIS